MPEILFFPYFGPNRRSDRRVVELRLDFGSNEGSDFPQQLADIRHILDEAGILGPEESFPGIPLPDNRTDWYSSLLAQTALLFQKKAGHRVDYFSVSCCSNQNRCIALVEFKHCDVGMTAVKLAVELFAGKHQSLREPYCRFSEFARERLLSIETEAIVRAASRHGIPYFHLEQQPLAGKFNTDFRVRPNGLLMLGHGTANHVLDGTFCVDRSGDYLTALLRNPGQRLALLEQFGLPFSPTGKSAPTDSTLFHLLVINRQVTAIAELADGSRQLIDDVHASLIALTLDISEQAGFAPVAVSLRALNLAQPLGKTNGVVLDFDLAPDLGLLLSQCKGGPDLLNSAATRLIEWLFPDQDSARMPIIAVTGTNGKTTTSRMINHILRQAGRKPGLVCTDGIFVNGKQVSQGDAGSFVGHARVLSSKRVDVAVLEAHHRGIAVRGFAFDKCNIAVCLNVTEEHLADGEIESVEEMAEIKRALLERACDAVVLNVDDAHCRAMLGHVTADRNCLVSMQSSVKQLRELAGRGNVKVGAFFCVLENEGGREWLVVYDGNRRIPIISVDQIPATFDGTARFNISNAMHATAATFLSGANVDHIRAALATFSAGQEMTPGRMNVFDKLPFRIILDFAHNADGMKKICEFVDLQKVSGRKLIAFSGADKYSHEVNRRSAQTIAGHFDFYFCKDYEPIDPPRRKFVGPFMQQALIEAGVPEHQTMVLTFGRDVIFRIFDACEPGDLLIVLAGHAEIHTVPEYIGEYTRR